ncbi:MAG: TonB-dependent receptor [Sphingobacteriales bacterium]|nr:MAG: TonB-dependent receptor [Sphingobacteriales bacterium]
MRILTMSFMLLLISLKAFSIGNISGKITDEKTGDPIIGATVVVKGTSKGGATDVDGNFMIQVDAGTYIVQVNYIGYQTKEVEEVKVDDNATAMVNAAITESKSTQLNEVVVRTTMKKENINSLYTIQKNNASISDGISADVIRKSPDRSTGEVLKRVSGTTIQDNKFVIVRGLSDRYNVGMVDNAVLPSTEPNRKAFSFDIIPANLIDNIIITKTATPDLPGDFAGGVINILTKEIPEQNFNTISLGASYNTASTFKTFKSGYRSSTDFLGFDDGARKLPSDLPSTAKVTNGLTDAQNVAAINTLNNDFNVKERSALPGMNLQASLGRSYLTKKNNRFGVVAAVNYNHTETREPNLQRLYDSYDYDDNGYKYSTNLGAMLNLGYSFGNSKIVLKTLYNQIFDDYFMERTGGNSSIGKDIQYYAYDLFQKSLFKTSLEGDHKIGKKQSKINWLVAYNRVNNDQPDQRKVQYGKLLADQNDPSMPYVAEVGTSGKANNRLFSKLGENIYAANLNYTLPLEFLNKTTLKIGLATQYRERTFDARFIGMTLDEKKMSPEEAQAIKTQPVGSVFGQDYINKGYYTLVETTLPSDAYTANSNTNAGYVMLDNKFSDKFRLVWGARVESFNIQLASKNNGGAPVTVDETWVDVLPSANFTYSLNQKINLRASYYKTVARPEFRELAPFAYYDYELSALSFGNQSLQRSQIHNADLRFEMYPNAGEILSASVFYKRFNNTLEQSVYATTSQLEISARNYESAQNIGVEAEIRKSLSFIAPSSKFAKNLSFYANVAYIKSQVNGNDTSSATGAITKVDRPLTGQSNYVINTSLTYAAMDGKLNFNILYNRIGPRIFLVGGENLGNVWEQPRNLLDFQVAYNVSKRSEFRFNVKDMLNAQYFFYYDQNRNDKYDGVSLNTEGFADPKQDYILKKFKPGTTFSLTYTYKF